MKSKTSGFSLMECVVMICLLLTGSYLAYHQLLHTHQLLRQAQTAFNAAWITENTYETTWPHAKA